MVDRVHFTFIQIYTLNAFNFCSYLIGCWTGLEWWRRWQRRTEYARFIMSTEIIPLGWKILRNNIVNLNSNLSWNCKFSVASLYLILLQKNIDTQ